jgi:hypothetical protein
MSILRTHSDIDVQIQWEMNIGSFPVHPTTDGSVTGEDVKLQEFDLKSKVEGQEVDVERSRGQYNPEKWNCQNHASEHHKHVGMSDYIGVWSKLREGGPAPWEASGCEFASNERNTSQNLEFRA